MVPGFKLGAIFYSATDALGLRTDARRNMSTDCSDMTQDASLTAEESGSNSMNFCDVRG